MTLAELKKIMWQYNQAVAYGSECAEWQDFVNECYKILGVPPWHDDADEIIVPEEMALYWTDVANTEE